jgi:hypothetical protein
MWRYIKEPYWNIELKTPSCGTIPHNYYNEIISIEVPLYYHYKCYDLSWDSYLNNGSTKKSSLNTGLPRKINGFDDLFFDEDKPYEDGYFNFKKATSEIITNFGNPARISIDSDGKAAVINSNGVFIHELD